MKRARRFAVFLLVRAAFACASILPLRVALAIGRVVGLAGFFLAARPRRIALRQLVERLGVSESKARWLAREAFASTGELVAELAAIRGAPALERSVEFPDEARELLDRTLADGQGAIVVTGHIGNFELLARRVAIAGYDVATLARAHPNPFIAEWLVAERARARVETIERKDPRAARKILGALRRRAILGVLIDQDTSVRSAFVPFFGELAKTPTVAAELAQRRATPLLVAYVERDGDARCVRVERLDTTGLPETTEDAVVELTARMSAALERAIRRDPASWVWYHERWRSRPELGDGSACSSGRFAP
ncbi:MAG: lysophospholipid acyltransferase family protein [Deltaproteobacteria bacterium]|nr:lysophospholipid acyltransferase family protein [Deltaproteobacteria bacterium]